MAKKNDQAARKALAEAEGAGSLDKIRDILFGAQVKEHERKISHAEERFHRELVDLRGEVGRRLEALESYVKQEVSTILDRLKHEQGERADAVKEVAKELATTAKGIEKRIGQLDDQLTKAERGLNEQILRQTKSLQDELTRSQGDNAAALERAVGALEHAKTDRAALSALFADIAMRLTDDGEAGGG